MDELGQSSGALIKKQNKTAFTVVGIAMIAFFAAIQIVAILLSFLAGYLKLDFVNEIPALGNMLLATIPMLVIGLPVMWLIMKAMPRVNAAAVAPIKKSKLTVLETLGFFSISYAAIVGLGMFSNLLNFLFSALKGEMIANPVQEMIGHNIWFEVLAIAIVAPIVEEIVFRGFMLKKLRPYGDGIAVFASAFLFGMMHGNFSQFFYAFGVGLVFGYITIKTGRLSYAIVLHMVINFLGSTVPSLLMRTQSVAFSVIWLTFMMTIVAIGIMTAVLNRKKVKFEPSYDGVRLSKKIGWFFSSVGVIVYIVAGVGLMILYLFIN